MYAEGRVKSESKRHIIDVDKSAQNIWTLSSLSRNNIFIFFSIKNLSYLNRKRVKNV